MEPAFFQILDLPLPTDLSGRLSKLTPRQEETEPASLQILDLPILSDLSGRLSQLINIISVQATSILASVYTFRHIRLIIIP